MTSSASSASFAERFGQIEKLLGRIEQSSDVAACEAARELVRSLLDLHGTAVRRMLQIVTGRDGGRESLDAFLQDDLVRSLFLLHDLHPESLEERVQQALEQVRPYLRSHGGNVELLELTPGRLLLRLEGSCQGCPSSTATLHHTIEQAIYEYAPDVGEICVAGNDPSPAATPADLIPLRLPADPGGSSSRVDARRPLEEELASQEPSR